jgi:1-acyl-sn-glycerol-3-phosphate acyltransferase
MEHNTEFDDIRPFYDEEINEAMKRIANSKFFPTIASYVYPSRNIEDVRRQLCNYHRIEDFQLEVMRNVNEQVIEHTMTEFTYGGISLISRDKRYLFISNHRDIMLDACLLQYVLYRNGHHTSEITFGSNLMKNPIVVDIGKSNKMFRVERDAANMKEFYRNSLHLSRYINYVITEKGQSVWIAQRNGRTKDGNDMTDQGVVKMLGMNKPEDKIRALEELNIVPISISYEWEPCDILKALELYESRGTKYIKKPGEDLNSIITGIIQAKGRVHIQICKPITRDDLLQFTELTNSAYNRKIAELIDKRIYEGYLLMPNNYIAHDILYGNLNYKELYTEEQRKAFIERLNTLDDYQVDDISALRDIFLGIYANPVRNCAAHE